MRAWEGFCLWMLCDSAAEVSMELAPGRRRRTEAPSVPVLDFRQAASTPRRCCTSPKSAGRQKRSRVPDSRFGTRPPAKTAKIMTKSRSKSSRRAKVAAKPKAPAVDAEEEKVTGFKEGRWDDDEHDRFIVAMADFVDGNNAPVNQSARREKWGAIAAARARVRRPREVVQPFSREPPEPSRARIHASPPQAVGTRSTLQCRSHAQKHYIKEKKQRGPASAAVRIGRFFPPPWPGARGLDPLDVSFHPGARSSSRSSRRPRRRPPPCTA